MSLYVVCSLVSIIFWLVLAAIFSGVETGMYSINKFRLTAKAKGGDPDSLRLQGMLARPGDLVCTLLVGTNLSIYVASAQFTGLLDSLGIWSNKMVVALLTTLILSPIILLFSEKIPKEMFRRRAGSLTRAAARSVRVFWLLFRPAVLLLRGPLLIVERGLKRNGKKADLLFSRQDLADLITVGAREGVISPYQADMARKAMKLRRVPLADVMIPLEQITMVEKDSRADTFLDIAKGRRHSRIVVFDKSRTNIVGAVNIFDVFYDPSKGETVADYVEPVLNFSKDALTSQALLALQKEKRIMALIVDGAGAPVGVVTVKDLVEEIAGEISDW